MSRFIATVAGAIIAAVALPAVAAGRAPDGAVKAQQLRGSGSGARTTTLERTLRLAALPIDPDALAAAKAKAAALLRKTGGAATAAPGAATAVFGGLNGPGLNHNDNAPRNDGTPPDTPRALL